MSPGLKLRALDGIGAVGEAGSAGLCRVSSLSGDAARDLGRQGERSLGGEKGGMV